MAPKRVTVQRISTWTLLLDDEDEDGKVDIESDAIETVESRPITSADHHGEAEVISITDAD